MSLASTFLATFETKQAGLDYINHKLGTNHKHSSISRWERGTREPDRATREVMLKRVLPDILAQHGSATPAHVRAALDKLL